MPAAAVYFRHQATGSALLQQHCSLLESKLLSLQRKAGHQALGNREVEVRRSLCHLRRTPLYNNSHEHTGPEGHQNCANQPEVMILLLQEQHNLHNLHQMLRRAQQVPSHEMSPSQVEVSTWPLDYGFR